MLKNNQNEIDTVVENFGVQFDELKMKPPKGSMPGMERELLKWFLREALTTAYNKGVEVGRERCIERIRQGHFAKVADDNWNDENTYGYKEAIKDIISTLDKEVSL